MTSPSADLSLLLGGRPELRALANAVLDVWPEHDKYLARSFRARSPELLDVSESAASAVHKLVGGSAKRFAENYRWTCDRLREEELYFHREGRYRLSTFKEAEAEVYSNRDYMRRYMEGLLLTQILWYNHVATLEMFLARFLGAKNRPFDYLEVGPGHGLMTSFAAQSELSRRIEAWDVSPVSLQETRAALETLGVMKPVSLVETDILSARKPHAKFDLVVISEVLEHLETPDAALRFLASAIAKDGRIFVNVPINSPSPDHLFLFASPGDVRALIEGAGLRIERMELYATQAKPIERALAERISVSAGVIARVS